MFSERLKHLRKARGLTQEELARRIGVERSSVGKYESTKTIPSVEVLQSISRELGVSIDYLLGHSDAPIDYDNYDTSEFYVPIWRRFLDMYNGNMSQAVPAYIAFKKAQDEDSMLENAMSEEGSYPNAPQSTGGVWIPVVGKVAAGTPITAVEDIIDYEEIPKEMAHGSKCFGLQINGDSMEPRMKKGDVVIVRKQEDVDSGQIAVVMVNGDEATVKRVMKQADGIMLVAFNPAYEPVFYSNKDIVEKPVTICGRVIELRAKF